MKTCPKCNKQFNPGWDKQLSDPIVQRMRDTGLCWFCSAGINMERAPRKRRSGPPPAAQPSPTIQSNSSLRVTTSAGTDEGGGIKGNGEVE